jgi:hypothetical protein
MVRMVRMVQSGVQDSRNPARPSFRNFFAFKRLKPMSLIVYYIHVVITANASAIVPQRAASVPKREPLVYN